MGQETTDRFWQAEDIEDINEETRQFIKNIKRLTMRNAVHGTQSQMRSWGTNHG